MKVPSYPNFVKIDSSIAYEIHTLSLIDERNFFTSDFSYNSILNWSLKEKENYISQIKDSYIIKMFDIVNDGYFYVPFTHNEKAFKGIMNICYEDNLPVSLIQKYLLDFIDKDLYDIEENTIYNDYILKIDDYLNASGNDYKWIRKKINNFKTNHLNSFTFKINKLELLDVSEIKNFMAKNFVPEERLKIYELEALNNCLANLENFYHVLAKVYFGDILIAYDILEYHNPKVMITNFNKSLKDYRVKGFNEYFLFFMCEELKKQGWEYINLEQDIGLPNLAATKLSYQPDRIIKKYTLIRKGHKA